MGNYPFSTLRFPAASSLTIFLIILFTACNSASQPETPKESETVQTPTSEAGAEKTLPFPVAEKFSAVEYLFEYQNDTTYVINFWATWCKPCVAELPYFERLHEEMSGEKVKVVLLSLDFAKDVDTKLLKFVNTKQLQPEVIALTDGKYGEWIDKVSPEWSGAIPVTYIYKNTNKLFHDTQYVSYEELFASVQKVKNAG
jgi:thiol-disulfide isomerase/thioredoxin